MSFPNPNQRNATPTHGQNHNEEPHGETTKEEEEALRRWGTTLLSTTNERFELCNGGRRRERDK